MASRLLLPILGASLLLVMPGTGCSKKKAEPAAGAAHGGHAHPKGDAAMTPSKVSPQAKVFFRNLKGGQQVEGPLKDGKVEISVLMGASDVEIRPAGEQVDNSGHHHIVIDGSAVPFGKAVPADDTHIHFGKGQTETKVALSPGKHTLTLQLADGFHLSYGPKVSATIEIEVKPASKPAPVTK